jgi:hypothetical protein
MNLPRSNSHGTPYWSAMLIVIAHTSNSDEGEGIDVDTLLSEIEQSDFDEGYGQGDREDDRRCSVNDMQESREA